MASSPTGAASYFAAETQQAAAATVPPSPRPLQVMSWNTGPGHDRFFVITRKLKQAQVASEFGVILLQELPGQWADPMTPEKVKGLLHQASPSY